MPSRLKALIADQFPELVGIPVLENRALEMNTMVFAGRREITMLIVSPDLLLPYDPEQPNPRAIRLPIDIPVLMAQTFKW